MNGSHDHDSPAVSQIPPVDVDDALQYTPLSSVVPLATGAPPPPLALTRAR